MARRRVTYGAPAAQHQSRLLILTPELRNRIYHYVFTVDSPDDKVNLVHSSLVYSTRLSVLTLLETCRQVLSEAEGLFYFCNHFQLSFNAGSCLAAIPMERASSLRQLTLKTHYVENLVHALKHLRYASGLDVLHVDLVITSTTYSLGRIHGEQHDLRKWIENAKSVSVLTIDLKKNNANPYYTVPWTEVVAAWNAVEASMRDALEKAKAAIPPTKLTCDDAAES